MNTQEYVVTIQLRDIEVIYDENFVESINDEICSESIDRMINEWILSHKELILSLESFNYEIYGDKVDFDLICDETQYDVFIDLLETYYCLTDWEYNTIISDEIPNTSNNKDMKIDVRLECTFIIKSTFENIANKITVKG